MEEFPVSLKIRVQIPMGANFSLIVNRVALHTKFIVTLTSARCEIVVKNLASLFHIVSHAVLVQTSAAYSPLGALSRTGPGSTPLQAELSFNRKQVRLEKHLLKLILG